MSRSDRVIVTSSAGNFIKIYSVDASTGGLTLQTTITVASPTAVASHPSQGTFFVSKNNATLECYKFDFRRGTGPTATSSTAITNIVSVAITPDGNSIVYGRTGQNFIYWRTVSDCDLGSENSVATGTGQIDQILPATDSTFVFATTTNTRMYRFNRDTRDGSLALSNSAALVTGDINSQAMTTDNSFVLTSNVAGTNSYRTSDFGIVSTGVGPSIAHMAIGIGSDKIVVLRIGLDHWGATISSAGVITAGSTGNYGLGDFNGGLAVSPSRDFFYVGDQSNTSVWAHKVTTTSPFSGTPIQVNVGAASDGIAYLVGWSG